MQFTVPDFNDKQFIHYSAGGYSTCCKIEGNNCLPNCVAWAHAKMKIDINENCVDWKVPACNAEDWLESAQTNGLATGESPIKGAIMVWKQGNTYNSADGCGHVAYVESVEPDGSVWVSESGLSYYYRIRKIPRPYNYDNYVYFGCVLPLNYKEETKTTYTVVKGDTLWSIATHFLGKGSRYPEIMLENGLTNTTINVGQVLTIPSK